MQTEAEHHLLLWVEGLLIRKSAGPGALLGPKSGWKVSHKEMWNKDPPKYHNDSTSLRETGWFFADDDG